MRNNICFVFFLTITAQIVAQQAIGDYPYKGVPFTAVKLTDRFWLPKMEFNRTNTIPQSFAKCESTGRVKNFELAAQHSGKFCSKYPFDDSDVYKTLEGASYSLHIHPDPKLDAYCDSIIAKIAKAQEPDGYLYTARSIDSVNGHPWIGKTRWENEAIFSHELYNLGHLYEAASAHYLATGKRNLLNVAIKSADCVDRAFGPGKKRVAPGHEVIEMGLVKMYRVTQDLRYLRLAKFFIDARGQKKYNKESDDVFQNGKYWQDDKPVIEQTEAVGHAVRAVYLYTGMADVAALTGERAYIDAINKIWDNAVSKKTYVTGGIGAAGNGERFSDDYDLPNQEAYCETCAAIGNVYWNYRMFLLNGDAKYYDLIERIIYNGFLSGVGLDGKTFFYTNPMETNTRGGKPTNETKRSEWFTCACCPTNISRFVPSIPGYAYARRNNDVYINLFMSSSVVLPLDNGNKVELSQQSDYPWNGAIRVTVDNFTKNDFQLNIRVPGWSRNVAFPSDLYTFADPSPAAPQLKINGVVTDYALEKGYAVLRRPWKKGDVVELTLPMDVRQVVANPKLKIDAGKVALLRGPLVYCAEFPDNAGHTANLILPATSRYTATYQKDLLGGVVTLQTTAVAVKVDSVANTVTSVQQPFTAIPFFARCNRGEGEMRIWFPQKVTNLELLSD